MSTRQALDEAIYQKYIRPIQRPRRLYAGVEFELPIVNLERRPVDFQVVHALTQDDLARKMQFMGMEMTPLIISRIEQNQRHVCDAELRMLAKALDVSMDWLCGDSNEITLN